tara:strand:- start:456 stop:839 length:384 start_codon:yes stop_codon:yes gene_type:complete
MKFIALLIASASAAAVADKADCSTTAGTTCTVTESCCGKVTGTGAPTTSICFTKTAKDYIITAAVVKVDAKAAVVASAAGVTPVVVAADAVVAVAAVAEVKGTFACDAGATYMTVGAAMIAAAALLQ